MSNFMRITAGSFSTSVTTTFWDRREALHQTRLAEASSVFDPAAQQALSGLHAAGLSDPQSAAVLTRGLVGQAYLLSTLDYFWISAWLCLLLIVPIWFAKRTLGSGPAAAAE
jgi:DHA2 family multidrug resistance protein